MQSNMSLDELSASLVACRKCPRLVAWREQVALEKRAAHRNDAYWGKPVPGFGLPDARLLILGLAPGAHGSNRTGRQFTGDGSGDFLFPALFRAGFANRPNSIQRGDGLELCDCYITAVCHCAPPQNKPKLDELRACRPWLQAELAALPRLQGIVVLGRIAFEGLLALPAYQNLSKTAMPFGHSSFYRPTGLPWILCSYHPSRQNTQTGRLTVEMFDAVWQKARAELCASAQDD